MPHSYDNPEPETDTNNTAGAVAQERLVRRCDTCRHFRLDTEKDGHKWGDCTWDSPVPDHYKKREESKMSILSVACGSLAFGEECNAWQGFAPTEDTYTIAACDASLILRSPSELPEHNGEILVALWGAHEWEIVSVTENIYGLFSAEYKGTGDPASPDEWQWWVDLRAISLPNVEVAHGGTPLSSPPCSLSSELETNEPTNNTKRDTRNIIT
jgi:hypothetical protein